jgi:hypothetical protein
VAGDLNRATGLRVTDVRDLKLLPTLTPNGSPPAREQQVADLQSPQDRATTCHLTWCFMPFRYLEARSRPRLVLILGFQGLRAPRYNQRNSAAGAHKRWH